MKRLIALDSEEYTALSKLANATTQYIPTYQTLSLSSGFYYVFDTEESAHVEKILLLGAQAGLRSP